MQNKPLSLTILKSFPPMSLFLILRLISCLLLTISHTLSRSLRNRWATSLTTWCSFLLAIIAGRCWRGSGIVFIILPVCMRWRAIVSSIPLIYPPLRGVLYNLAKSTYSWWVTITGILGNVSISAISYLRWWQHPYKPSERNPSYDLTPLI